MYCTQCGQPIIGNFCSNCGAANTPQTPPPATVYSTATVPPVSPTIMSPGTPVAPPKTDDLAIASLVLGVLSMLVFSFLAGIPAVILGHKSRGRIRRSMGQLTGEGMALAGLVMGYLSFLAIPFILIIAAIAIPNLLRARMAANEASAVGAVRSINTAQTNYAASNPQIGYTCSLNDLQSGASLDARIASGMKNGYRFELVACDGSPVQHYTVLAEPVQPGTTGNKTYCSDESGEIHSMAKDETGSCMDVGQKLESF